jgi:hypothetical protein
VQEGYFNLVEYPPLLENVVKLTIVSPLLFIAGLYLSPFHIKAEKSLEIRAEDEGVIIDGRIDILVLKQNFWVTVIESKQTSFSLEEGLAQILTYSTSCCYKVQLVRIKILSFHESLFNRSPRKNSCSTYSGENINSSSGSQICC